MAPLQILAVLAGAFWIVAGVVLITRSGGRGRALGVVSVVVGAVMLGVVALWIAASTPLVAPAPGGTRFPPLP